jgi:hypothetical protein
MISLLRIFFSLALALWLGGLISLFVFVQHLFKNDRAIAVDAAPMLFRAFETYRLPLLGAAALSIVVWFGVTRSRAAKRWIMALAFLVLTADTFAIAQSAFVSRKMHAIPSAERSGPEFKRLHGFSMMLYTGEAALLAIAAALLPATIARDALQSTPRFSNIARNSAGENSSGRRPPSKPVADNTAAAS